MKTTRIVLIFNPSSGSPADSPQRLLQILLSLQEQSIFPQVYLTSTEDRLEAFIKQSLHDGTGCFAVCGGDGTIGCAARALAGSAALLAIIPTGTQNNIAMSLQIPIDIPSAAGLITRGKALSIDLGYVTTAGKRRPFIEVCSLGLISALFPSADHIQHGDLAGIGDFLSLLVSTPGASFTLDMDGDRHLRTPGHSVLISNMPFLGPHFQIAPDSSCHDGLLDVMVFSDMTRLDLIDYALPGVGQDENAPVADPRLQHFHVRKLTISSDPPLPILADGASLGEGSMTLEVKRQALKVLVAGSYKT